MTLPTLTKRLAGLPSFPLALAVVLAFWVSLMFGREFADPDIWWHLKNAHFLFEHGGLPHFDTYSYTVAGHAWMNHEWLAEIPYYLAWRAGGIPGVYALSFVLAEALLLGIFVMSWKTTGNLKGAFLVAGYSVLLCVVSFGPRTILFGYLYLLALVWLLYRYRNGQRSPLWVIPPLFCVWINTHGSWLLGLIVFGLFLCTGLVSGSWGNIEARKWTPVQRRHLLTTALMSLAGLLVNPYTYRLVWYPFDLAYRQKLNIANVAEWVSVDFHDARGKVVLILLAGLLLAALVGRRRWNLEDLALAGFGLYCGLTHIRFLVLASILLAPLLTKMLDSLPPYRPEIDKPRLNALIVLGLLVAMAVRYPTAQALSEDVRSRFPAGALAYVKSQGLRGPIFNLYMWGGFITWHHPEIKTFIDSRTDIFEYKGVLKDYLDAISLRGSLAVLDKYGINYVLMPPNDPVCYLLKNNVHWKQTFADATSMILERAGDSPCAEDSVEKGGDQRIAAPDGSPRPGHLQPSSNSRYEEPTRR